MARTREKEPQNSQSSSTDIFPEFRYGWKPDLDEAANLYSRLPEGKTTPLHEQRLNNVSKILWEAVTTYHKNVGSPDLGKVECFKASNDFNEVIEKARRLNLPSDKIMDISSRFIDAAFDPEENIPDHIRKAIISIGTAVGSDDVSLLNRKVQYIASRHLGIKGNREKKLDDNYLFENRIVKSMYDSLGVTNVAQVRSRTEFFKVNSRKITYSVVAAAAMTTIVLNPSLANAVESQTYVSTPEVNLESSTSPVVMFSTATETSATIKGDLAFKTPMKAATNPEVISAGAPVEAPVSEIIDVKVGVQEGTKAEVSVSVSTAEKTPTVEAPVAVPITFNAEVEVPKQELIASATPIPETVTDNVKITAPKPIVDKSGKEEVTTPDVVSAKPIDDSPKLDPETATPGQLLVEKINYYIKSDRSISSAAELIRLNFHDKSIAASSTVNGQPVYPVTNIDLVNHIAGSKKKGLLGLDDEYLKQVSHKNFHTDANYVNNTLTAFAVLEAFAYDQSILKSADVQQLIANVKQPDGDYESKLFAQYISKAQEALAADESKLIKGIDDSYKPQLETMYAYILLAGISDTDQATAIQGIKDAEAATAKAAAEAAAKAAAETGAKAEYSKTAEAEALKKLIDQESDGPRKYTFMTMSFLMDPSNADLDAIEATAAISNLLGESGMRTGAVEEAGGYGHGIAQWERGRWIALQALAKAEGKPWTDLDVQHKQLLSELSTINNTLKNLKKAPNIFEATKTFIIDFETPRVVLNAKKSNDWSKVDAEVQRRINLGQPYLDALNKETAAVNQARTTAEAAAAEAAKAAEKERQVEMGMNLEQASAFIHKYGVDPESIKYIGNSATDCNGGALSNCVSLSMYFVNKFTDFVGFTASPGDKSHNPGDGKQVVDRIKLRNPDVSISDTPRINSIFSQKSGKYGHTGIILGIDKARGVVIVGEAKCMSRSDNGVAIEYPLSQFENGDYVFAYTAGHLTSDLQ